MKILDIEKVYKGFLTILNIKVQTSTGEVISREVMSRSGGDQTDDSVSSLVYNTTKGKFIFVKQFRPGLMNESDQNLIEVVAGTLEVNEDPRLCMEREIEEETGYGVDSMVSVGSVFTSPGGTTEKINLYISMVSEKISEGGGLKSEHEEIDVIEMTLEEVNNHNFLDMKTKLLITEISNIEL